MFPSNRPWYDLRSYLTKLVILIVVGLVGLFGLAGIDSLSYDETLQTGNWELIPVRYDSDKESGGLSYAYVSDDTNENYSFYYQTSDDDNVIKKGKVETDAATIYEEDNCTPHVVEYTIYTKNTMNRTLRMILAFGYGESTQKTYEIYTPIGTIFRISDLDSQ
jgi:hypothetical protein